MNQEQVCSSCQHPVSSHYLANAGACGDPECCGIEYVFCDDCCEACCGVECDYLGNIIP